MGQVSLSFYNNGSPRILSPVLTVKLSKFMLPRNVDGASHRGSALPWTMMHCGWVLRWNTLTLMEPKLARVPSPFLMGLHPRYLTTLECAGHIGPATIPKSGRLRRVAARTDSLFTLPLDLGEPQVALDNVW
jgi:hypothetical protein